MIYILHGNVVLVKFLQLVHDLLQQGEQTVETPTVGILGHQWNIWTTHGHVCPHQHIVFFSKCVCMVFILKKLGFPSLFFLYHFSPFLPLSELI